MTLYLLHMYTDMQVTGSKGRARACLSSPIQDLTKLLDIACVSAHELAGWRLSTHKNCSCQLTSCLASCQDICAAGQMKP